MKEAINPEISQSVTNHPKLSLIVKKIQTSSQLLTLTPEEIKDIIDSGYLPLFSMLMQKHQKVFISIKGRDDGKDITMNCQEKTLNTLGVKLFGRFKTDRGMATLLGVHSNNIQFIIDGDKGSSYWDDIHNIGDLNRKKFTELKIGLAEEDIIETMRSGNALRDYNPQEERFIKRLTTAVENLQKDTVSIMLQCLVDRYKNQQFDIVLLPSDGVVIHFLNLSNGYHHEIFESFINYFNESRSLLKLQQYQHLNIESKWVAVFKQCLTQAIQANNQKVIELLVGQDVVHVNTLSAIDFTADEIKQLMPFVLLNRNETMLRILLVNGVINYETIKEITETLHQNSPALLQAEKFYQIIFAEKIDLPILTAFLKLLDTNNPEQSLMILQMFFNIIRSFPELESTNLAAFKKLVLQLHLCFSEGNSPLHIIYQDMLRFLYSLDFDLLANKSLFKDNKEKKEFFHSQLSGAIPTLEMTFTNNNNNNTVSLTKENSQADDLPNKMAPERLHEHLKIMMYDTQDYKALVEKLEEISADELATPGFELLAEFIKTIPAKFKGTVYAKMAQIIQKNDGEKGKKYLLNAAFYGDKTCLAQLTRELEPETATLMQMVIEHFLYLTNSLHAEFLQGSNICNKVNFDTVKKILLQYGQDLHETFIYLGRLFARSDFVLHDLDEALAWVSKAIQFGCDTNRILGVIHEYEKSTQADDKIFMLHLCGLIVKQSNQAKAILENAENDPDTNVQKIVAKYLEKKQPVITSVYLTDFSVLLKKPKPKKPVPYLIKVFSDLIFKRIKEIEDTNVNLRAAFDSSTTINPDLEFNIRVSENLIKNLKEFNKELLKRNSGKTTQEIIDDFKQAKALLPSLDLDKNHASILYGLYNTILDMTNAIEDEEIRKALASGP